MQKPQTKAEWAAIGIIGLLASMMAVRGIFAVVTQHYSGTARLSGPFDLVGLPAIYQGLAWIFFGLMIFSTLGLQFKLPRRYCLAAAGAALVAALGCLILSAIA